MKRRTARILRRAADRLDPKPARWYQVSVQTDTFTTSGLFNVTATHGGTWTRTPPKPKRRHRVLADYLSSMDLKKLRP